MTLSSTDFIVWEDDDNDTGGDELGDGVGAGRELVSEESLDTVANAIVLRAREARAREERVVATDEVEEGLWRVPVKVSNVHTTITIYLSPLQFGSERDVVNAIQNRLPENDAGRRHVTAFMHEAVCGRIYVSVKHPEDVDRILRGLADIQIRQGRVVKQLLPAEERNATRTMFATIKPAPFRRALFVRVRCRGQYRGALGLVKKVDDQASQVHVVVVERRARKQARRGDPDEVQDRRFVLLELAVDQVSDSNVGATHGELDFFLHSQKLWVCQAARQACVVLHVDDRVEVVAGLLKGLVSYVMSINTDGTMSLRFKDLAEEPCIHQRDVVRKFEFGEFVTVMAGQYKGISGFITEMVDGTVTLFPPNNYIDCGEVREQTHG